MSRVCILDHSYFPRDPRVRKEALALATAGHDVDVVCLLSDGEARSDTLGDRTPVSRLPVSRNRSRGKIGYLLEYAAFFLLAAWKVTSLDRRHNYDLVIVCNPPEELVFAAFVPRLRGARILLDIHDCLPPLFCDKYGVAEGGMIYRTLVRMELACCRFADHVFVAADPFRDRFVALGVPEDKITVVLNTPEPSFGPPSESPFVVVYTGSVFERYGFEVVLEGVARARESIPDLEFHLFGSDVDEAYVRSLKELAGRLGIADAIAFSGYVAPLALRKVMQSADVGLNPLRRSCHIDLTYATKVFDFLRFGLPVLSAYTPALAAAFPTGLLSFYDCTDSDDFANTLVRLAGERRAAQRTDRDSLLPEHMSWDAMASKVVGACEALVSAPRSLRGSAPHRDGLTARGDAVRGEAE